MAADRLGAQGACLWRAQAGAAKRILGPDGQAASLAVDLGPPGQGLVRATMESREALALSIWLVRRSHSYPGSLHVGSDGEGEGAVAQASLGGRGAGLREV